MMYERLIPSDLVCDCSVHSIEEGIAYCSGILPDGTEYDLDIPIEKFEGQSIVPGTIFSLDVSSRQIIVSKEVWTAEELENARVEGEKLYRLFSSKRD